MASTVKLKTKEVETSRTSIFCLDIHVKEEINQIDLSIIFNISNNIITKEVIAQETERNEEITQPKRHLQTNLKTLIMS